MGFIFQTIVCPVIDGINDTTFHYQFVYNDLQGLLNWKMEFEWQELPKKAKEKKSHRYKEQDRESVRDLRLAEIGGC